MTYRRLNYSDCWHFCPRCPHWRRSLKDHKVGDTVVERSKKPTTGEQCNLCRILAKKGACD